MTTVADNKKHYSKQQIKEADMAAELYGTVTYHSVADYIWAIHSDQIKEFPVTVQDIDVTIAIWGKDIFAIKGKTTRKKKIPVTEDLIQVPKELINIHRDIFMTADIFFVNAIPFFLTLSIKICFTMVHHIADRKAKTIYNAFNEVYIYYRKRGFRIITLHTVGEFAPLQAMITEHIPGGPNMNLTSANEHAP